MKISKNIQCQKIDISHKSKSIQSKSNKANKIKVKNSQKNQKLPKYWQKLEFSISQISGKIIKNYNKQNIPKNLDIKDINKILTVISKESRNFSPVKFNLRINFLFSLLCLTFFSLGIYYININKQLTGVLLILTFGLIGWIYIHIIRKCIRAKYKKCHQDLFYVTDEINRKYLSFIGYYLLIDYNFKFVGIYIVPYHIKQVLDFRDKNIELKKKLVGDTIDHLHKKEDIPFTQYNYNYNYDYNYYRKNIFNSHMNNMNNYTFGNNYYYNSYIPYYNKNTSEDNKITDDEEQKNNKIKFNNFFKDNNNKPLNIIKKPFVDNIDLYKQKRIQDITKNKLDNKDNYLEDKYEEMNSRNIDKSKEFLDSKFNTFGIINKGK